MASGRGAKCSNKNATSGANPIKLRSTTVAGENEATEEGLDVEPRPPSVIDWQGKLPKDGDYIIRAYLYRTAARRGTTTNNSLSGESHRNLGRGTSAP